LAGPAAACTAQSSPAGPTNVGSCGLGFLVTCLEAVPLAIRRELERAVVRASGRRLTSPGCVSGRRPGSPPPWSSFGVGIGLALMLTPYAVDSTHGGDGKMSCGLPLLEVIRHYLETTDRFHEAVVRVALGDLIGAALVGLGAWAAHLRAGPARAPSPIPSGS
jgi:hypothetical protein